MNNILEVVVSITSEPDVYNIQIFIDECDGTEVLILKIDQNYYFPELSSDQEYYYYLITNGVPYINFNANIPLTFIRYDYNHEEVVDARKGFVTFSEITSFQIIGLVPTNETDSSLWRNGNIVKYIEGPFQDSKLVTEIDLKKRVYYMATASTLDAHDAQLLSIKWEYQYNNGEFAQFINSKRSIVNDGGLKKCRLDCGYLERQDIRSVTIYAFFKGRSSNVSIESSTNNKKTESGELIWSAKVTPEFEKKVIDICDKLFGGDRKIEMANALMAVMSVETARTFKAHIIAGQNSGTLIPPEKITKEDFKRGETSSKAVGLIQFTQAALEQLGDFTRGTGFDKLHEVKLKYARMGEINQLDKVKDYLYPSRKRIKTPEDIYLQIFARIGVGKSDSFVLYESPSQGYDQNKSLDDDGNENKKIERGELLQRYYKLYEEGEKNKRVGEASGDFEDVSAEESALTTVWHNPVDNPRINKYNYSGIVKPASAVYGYGRRKSNGAKKYHSGVDLFAIPGKDRVYACLDCVLHQVYYSESAGWIVRVKINNVADLLEQEKKVNYTPIYGDEKRGIDIYEKDDVYLIYMHLQKVFFTSKDATNRKELKSGTILGYAGVSGSIASGGRAPHLHFEVSTKLNPYGTGEEYRTNGARFVKLNSYDTKDQDEAKKIKHVHKP